MPRGACVPLSRWEGCIGARPRAVWFCAEMLDGGTGPTGPRHWETPLWGSYGMRYVCMCAVPLPFPPPPSRPARQSAFLGWDHLLLLVLRGLCPMHY